MVRVLREDMSLYVRITRLRLRERGAIYVKYEQRKEKAARKLEDSTAASRLSLSLSLSLGGFPLSASAAVPVRKLL